MSLVDEKEILRFNSSTPLNLLMQVHPVSYRDLSVQNILVGFYEHMLIVHVHFRL